MTRIRFIEWFLAIILVIALHGAALTAWVWVTPKSALSQLPAKTPAPVQNTEASGSSAPLDMVVTLIEPDQSPEQSAASNRTVIQTGQETVSAPAPAAQPASAVEPASSGTVVRQSEPVVDLNKDTSQIAAITPSPSIASDGAIPDASTVELPPLNEIPDAAPAIDEQAPAEPAAPAAASEPSPAPAASSSPVRDPVPVPKAKPATAAPSTPPAEPPAAEQQVAAATPEQATATETPVSAAKSVYYRQLIARIKRARVYPSDARRAGKEGTVYMQIVVKRNGRIASYDIIKSSGHKELDDAAVQTLVKANPVGAFPEEVPGEELKFGVPLRYQVDAS